MPATLDNTLLPGHEGQDLSHALRVTLSTSSVFESERGDLPNPWLCPGAPKPKPSVSEISRFSMNTFTTLRCTECVSQKREAKKKGQQSRNMSVCPVKSAPQRLIKEYRWSEHVYSSVWTKQRGGRQRVDSRGRVEPFLQIPKHPHES